MIKLIRTSDTTWNDAVTTLIKVSSRGSVEGFDKFASASLKAEFEKLEPSDKYAWIHTLAIGSTEGFGPNRNGDGFREQELRDHHHTFTKHAHVFENHKNKDPAKAIGVLKFSAYNDDMRRCELIYGLEYGKADKYIQKVARGEDLAGSMGCRVDHDVCSICGHKAPSPKQYCDHAKLAMCQILDDGRQVYVDNPNPGFFDWSVVPRGADRTAFGFGMKAASYGGETWVSSVDLAKHAGLWIPEDLAIKEAQERVAVKRALLKKLAEIEKEIETKMTPMDVKLKDSMEDDVLEDSDAQKLKKGGLESALEQFHNAQVILPVKDFLKLVSSGPVDDDTVEEVESRLPGVFGRLDADDAEDATTNSAFDGNGIPGGPLAKIVEAMVPQLGMGEAPLRGRIMITVIRGGPSQKQASARPPSDLPEIESIARLYASYKLAALAHPRNKCDDTLTRASVVQNYTHHAKKDFR